MAQAQLAQEGNTIAFAYLRPLKLRKKQFFVLRSQPRPALWEQQQQQLHQQLPESMKDFFLYVYKTEKHYQKKQALRVYNMSGLILLTRCSKKENLTVLGICFQEDALFLRFDTEDELNRWYFHLSKIHTLKRNFRWPELTHCFSVLLRPRDLAAPASGRKMVRPDLAGPYRLCLTDCALLLVRDSLLDPAMALPYRCIRSCVHSVNACFFQIHLGRLSPIGEGVLHFEAEQVSMMKEIVDALMRCLNKASNNRLQQQQQHQHYQQQQQQPQQQLPIPNASPSSSSTDEVKVKVRAEFNSRRHSKDVLSVLRQDIQQRASRLVRRSSAAIFSTKSSDASSSCADQVRNSIVLSGALECGHRSSSQPLPLLPPESASKDEYLDLSLTAGSGTSLLTKDSRNSQQQQLDTGSQSPSSLSSLSVCGAGACGNDCYNSPAAVHSPGTCSPKIADRANSLISSRSPHLQQLQQQQHNLLQRQRNRQTSLVTGFCGYGGGVGGVCGGGGGGHRDDRQLFVELSFPRPRTASDAAAAAAAAASGSQRWARNRAGSYGNRSVACCGCVGGGCSGIGWMSSSEQMHSCADHRSSRDSEGSYVPMEFIAPSTAAAADFAASDINQQDVCEDCEEEISDEEDPYWIGPSQVDQRLRQPVAE